MSLDPKPAAKTPRPAFNLANILIPALMAVIAVGGVYAYYYYTEFIVPKRETEVNFRTLMTSLSYLTDPGITPFVDSDGDLVLDPPADATKHLDPEVLIFAPPSGGDSAVVWKEFADHLAKTTGKKVELYKDVVQVRLQDLKQGKLHVVGVNAGSVPTAVRFGFVPAAVPATNDGTSTPRMEFLVRPDSAIKAPSDLKGKTITLTSNDSHAGFKAAIVLLKDKFGLEAESHYMSNRSGSDGRSIEGLAKRDYEAVAVSSDMLKRAEARGDIKPDQYRSIYQSDATPPECFGYLNSLKPELAKKVREAFESFAWAGTGLAREYGATGQTKFVSANYKQNWQVVRDVDERLVSWGQQKK